MELMNGRVLAIWLVYFSHNYVVEVCSQSCAKRTVEQIKINPLGCCSLTSVEANSKDPLQAICIEDMVEQRQNNPEMNAQAQMACFDNCMFLKKNFFIDENQPESGLNMTAIENQLALNMPEPKIKGVNTMLNTFLKCRENLNKFIPYAQTSLIGDIPCNPYASTLMLCVRLYALVKCPKEFFTATQVCQDSKQYMNDCILKNMFNM